MRDAETTSSLTKTQHNATHFVEALPENVASWIAQAPSIEVWCIRLAVMLLLIFVKLFVLSAEMALTLVGHLQPRAIKYMDAKAEATEMRLHFQALQEDFLSIHIAFGTLWLLNTAEGKKFFDEYKASA